MEKKTLPLIEKTNNSVSSGIKAKQRPNGLIESPLSRHSLKTTFFQVRQMTEFLCHPLQTEDYVVQPITDVSPPKWHLGHTTWFFEINLLQGFQPRYRLLNKIYPYIFNSYYESLGKKWPRSERGMLSRPTVKEVYDYRNAVNEKLMQLVDTLPDSEWPEFSRLMNLGLHHEEQHQELLVSDIKYIFFTNPLAPIYNKNVSAPDPTKREPLKRDNGYTSFPGGLVKIGHDDDTFSWDNEKKAHTVHLTPYKLKNNLVTNAEFVEFMDDGGYQNFRYWLSDGWDWVKKNAVSAPLYWQKRSGEWIVMTLNGSEKRCPSEPVCHVNFYEADAFARWADKRLPTEAEWENAARSNKRGADGVFLEDHLYHPRTSISKEKNETGLNDLFGSVWEWTASAYRPYPGFSPAKGNVEEYNGKFMANQMVIRGGSCVTPRNHIRSTYRNFFQPDKRWQFTGIRLADD